MTAAGAGARPGGVLVREARDGDAEGLIRLLGDVFAEYPGCVLDVDGEMPELRRIATSFARWGGRFWVAESEGRVVGSIGWSPAPAPTGTLPGEAPIAERSGPGAGGAARGGIELRKLYVDAAFRRQGLGARLCDLVEADARARGAAFVELWSDTRFVTAHRFYDRRGYVRGTTTRELHDRSATVEYYFRLRV